MAKTPDKAKLLVVVRDQREGRAWVRLAVCYSADMAHALPQPDVILDARGHHCPVPTLRLRRALEGAAPGSVVQLKADDPMARIDVPHFAAQAGMEILERTDIDGVLSFLIRKPA